MSDAKPTPESPAPRSVLASAVEEGAVISVEQGRGYVRHIDRRTGPSGQPSLVMLRYVANDETYSVSFLATDEIEVLL